MGVEAEHPVTKEFVTVIASHKAITHRPLWWSHLLLSLQRLH